MAIDWRHWRKWFQRPRISRCTADERSLFYGECRLVTLQCEGWGWIRVTVDKKRGFRWTAFMRKIVEPSLLSNAPALVSGHSLYRWFHASSGASLSFWAPCGESIRMMAFNPLSGCFSMQYNVPSDKDGVTVDVYLPPIYQLSVPQPALLWEFSQRRKELHPVLDQQSFTVKRPRFHLGKVGYFITILDKIRRIRL